MSETSGLIPPLTLRLEHEMRVAGTGECLRYSSETPDCWHFHDSTRRDRSRWEITIPKSMCQTYEGALATVRMCLSHGEAGYKAGLKDGAGELAEQMRNLLQIKDR